MFARRALPLVVIAGMWGLMPASAPADHPLGLVGGLQIGLGSGSDRFVSPAVHRGELYVALHRADIARIEDRHELVVQGYDRRIDRWVPVGAPLSLRRLLGPPALRSLDGTLYLAWIESGSSRRQPVVRVAALLEGRDGVRWDPLLPLEVTEAEGADLAVQLLDAGNGPEVAYGARRRLLVDFAVARLIDRRTWERRRVRGAVVGGLVAFGRTLYMPEVVVEWVTRVIGGQRVREQAQRLYVQPRTVDGTQLPRLGPLNPSGVVRWVATAVGPAPERRPVVATVEEDEIVLYRLAPDAQAFGVITRIAAPAPINDPTTLIVAELNGAIDVGIRTADGVFRIFHVQERPGEVRVERERLAAEAMNVQEIAGPDGGAMLTYIDVGTRAAVALGAQPATGR